jgi:large repetitive protein
MCGSHPSPHLTALALLAVGVSALAVLPGRQAHADTTDTGPVTATVTVVAVLTLTFTDDQIELSGAAGETPELLGAVSMTVTTNNPTGYSITVDPNSASLVGTGTAGTIAVTNIEVRDPTVATPAYVALTDAGAVTIHNQATPSTLAGDVIPNDYRVTIPAGTVPDYYTGAITYVATAHGP